MLIFISLFLAVAQERSQFIDRLALQPARIQIPAYVLAFLALELFPATGPVPFVYFQFVNSALSARPLQTVGLQMREEEPQRKSKFENAMGLTGLEPVTCFKIYHGKQARVQWLVH